MNSLFYFSFSLGLFIMTTHPAQAYLDPGSGSLLFQLLVGGVLSGMFAIKLYYRKIKLFFKKLSSPKQSIKEENVKEEKENDESKKNQ
jgi:hypothetical protein